MNVLLCGGIRKHHEFLYRQGYQVTWLIARDNQFPEDLKSPPKRLYVYSPDDPVEDVCAIALHLHEKHRFEKVFAFHDDSQELAICIAEATGLTFPFSMEALTNTRQKPVMRQRLHEAGIPSCWYAVAEDENELVRLAAGCGLPKLIVKPTDGTGSKSVVALQSPKDVDLDWARKHVPSYPVLLEEYMEGKEFSVESFSAHGAHYFAGITEKFIDSASFVETGHIFPAALSQDTATQITDYVARALTVLGVNNTAAHTEIMLTATGPRIIETHTRVGGDWIPTLVSEVTGIDLYELSARIQIDPTWRGAREVFDQASPKGCCGIRYTVPPAPDQLITSLEGLESAKAVEGVLEVYAIRKPGERTRPLADSFSRMAYVRAIKPSRSELVSTLEQAAACIRYGYEATAT
jgi:biotin carboxylase